MAKLPQEVTSAVWNSKRVLKFSDTSDIKSWASRERDFWHTDEPINPQIRQHYDHQRSYFDRFLSVANDIEAAPPSSDHLKNAVSQFSHLLSAVGNGSVLTTDCVQQKALALLKKQDVDAFALLSLASRSNGRDLISNIDTPTTLTVLLKAALNRFRPIAQADGSTDRDQLAELKNEYDKALLALRDHLEKLESERSIADTAETVASDARQEKWVKQTKAIGEDWEELKRVYEEKMALAAPATYWDGRAKSSSRQAIVLSIAFALAAAISLWAFFSLAIPHLVKPPEGISTLTALLPVLVPGFVGIWVLRILGRHLSECIQLVRDARERQTMVTTFLALMNDESTGKTLVKEEDRALILQALFRQSAITATDDSPPIHWAELLRRGR